MLSLLSNKQDVWQGTQLLAFDIAAAMGLIRRALIGDELTEKEKRTLKRTLTDMASVVPIGVLMLLPVSFNIVDLRPYNVSAFTISCAFIYLLFFQKKKKS